MLHIRIYILLCESTHFIPTLKKNVKSKASKWLVLLGKKYDTASFKRREQQKCSLYVNPPPSYIKEGNIKGERQRWGDTLMKWELLLSGPLERTNKGKEAHKKETSRRSKLQISQTSQLYVYQLTLPNLPIICESTNPPVVAVAGWPVASFLLTSTNTALMLSS